MLRREEQAALQVGSGAVVAIGDDGRIGFASPDARRLLGWDEALVGQPLSILVPQRLHTLFRSGFGHFVATSGLATGGLDQRGAGKVHRHPARLRDGSERPVQIHVQGFRRPDGSLFVCAGLAPDPGPGPTMETVAEALANHGYLRL